MSKLTQEELDRIKDRTILEEGAAYHLQMLARHQLIHRMLADIAVDMRICRLEGWDIWEYPEMLMDAIPKRSDYEVRHD